MTTSLILLALLIHLSLGITIATLYAIANYNRKTPIQKRTFWKIALYLYPFISLHILFVEFPRLFGWIHE